MTATCPLPITPLPWFGSPSSPPASLVSALVDAYETTHGTDLPDAFDVAAFAVTVALDPVHPLSCGLRDHLTVWPDDVAVAVDVTVGGWHAAVHPGDGPGDQHGVAAECDTRDDSCPHHAPPATPGPVKRDVRAAFVTYLGRRA